MKRLLALCLLLLLLSPFSHVSASEQKVEKQTSESCRIYDPEIKQEVTVEAEAILFLSDGGKIITTAAREISSTKASGSVTGSKQHLFVNSSNVLQFRVTLTGTFQFNGTSSSCTAASSVTDVLQGNWSESSNNTFASANAAVADVTVVRKILFIVVETQNVALTIHCDRNGNLY